MPTDYWYQYQAEVWYRGITISIHWPVRLAQPLPLGAGRLDLLEQQNAHLRAQVVYDVLVESSLKAMMRYQIKTAFSMCPNQIPYTVCNTQTERMNNMAHTIDDQDHRRDVNRIVQRTLAYALKQGITADVLAEWAYELQETQEEEEE